MTTRRRSPAEPPPPVHRLQRAARALRRPFSALVGLLVAPLARAWTWRSRPVAYVDVEPTGSLQEGAPTAPTVCGRPMERSPGFADPRALADVEVIEVAAEFSEPLYAPVLDQLQLGRGSKLLDLRAARALKIGLFDRLASDWRAPRGTVPRLGIVLGFEQWTVLRHVAARRLRPLADRGVQVEMFYPQQSDSLPGWFAGGDIRHDRLRDVIAWLRTDWRPGAIWPTVLSRTESLVQAHAEIDAVPEMLLELAAIARSFSGAEGAEQAAQHARAALSWVGDQPSRARCRALRAVAASILPLGQTEAGLALLETAITTAAVLRDPIEEASALAEIGFHALRRGHVARAEARFRTALELLPPEGPSYLRATLHHDLALALHTQRKDAEEAERHATAALGLRWDRGSQLASQDLALIALISARRASPRS
jgi:tetratricopeptide (TPR) repeat protein